MSDKTTEELLIKGNKLYRVKTTIKETEIDDIAETISNLKTRQGELLAESDEITKKIQELNSVI